MPIVPTGSAGFFNLTTLSGALMIHLIEASAKEIQTDGLSWVTISGFPPGKEPIEVQDERPA